MRFKNSKIFNRSKELPVAALAKGLTLTKEERACLKENVAKIEIAGIIDKDIAKPADGVELIYLMALDLKDDCVPIISMTAFDKQTHAHTIWEIPWGAKMMYYIANKTIKDGKITLGNFYGTDPLPGFEELFIDEHIGSTLAETYGNLYSYVVGLPRRDGEIATDIENRSKRIKALEKEADKLERKKNSEIQFNKKTEINDQIRKLMAEIQKELA